MGDRASLRPGGLARATYIYGTAAPRLNAGPRPALDCPRCETELVPAEFSDTAGNKVAVLRCILCGAYVEPGHVPDDHVVRTVRGPRGPRK